MDFQRRRIALLETLHDIPTQVLDALEAEMAPTSQSPSTATATSTATTTSTVTAPVDTPSSTIAPYHSGLAGVDQPGNLLFKDVLWWSLGVVALLILSIRLAEIAWAKLRQVSAMSATADRQQYWRGAQWSWMPSLKKKLIYAPIWKKRHNREIKLSSAVNIGTLPSRLHSILLLGYLGSNLVYMFWLGWDRPNKYSLLAELRGRSGTLAAVNMVPLIILAGRNNLLIPMLKISFDTYNSTLR